MDNFNVGQKEPYNINMPPVYTHLYKLYKLLLIQSYTEELKLEEMLMPKKVVHTGQLEGGCAICSGMRGLRSFHSACSEAAEIRAGSSQTFSDLLLACFHIKLVDEKASAEICDECVSRLKDAALFREQAEAVGQLQFNTLNTSVESNDLILQDCKKTSIESMDMVNLCETDYSDSKEFDKESSDDVPLITKGIKKIKTKKKEINKKFKALHKRVGKKKDANGIKNVFSNKAEHQIPMLHAYTRQCPVCQKKFPTREMLHVHFGEHFPQHLCEICGKAFAKKSLLRTHMDFHKAQRFPCLECSKTFAHRDTMRQHTKVVHEGIKIYCCRHCSERFSNNQERREHLAKMHNFAIDMHNCPHCNRACYTAHKLDMHVRQIHLKEKNVTCVECQRMFFCNRLLRKHMSTTHAEDRKYLCKICGKTFKTGRHLNQHLNIHYDIRKHKCMFCDQAFVQHTSLKVHLNSHHKNLLSTNPVK